ncbi:hypothetical protein DH2020_047345 [Rehmannia glutinosa]|uniref:RNase H type-1 domain-containing protein n=1 Tax=Rehmannia glutinosa TaxID=99300 RepID=A0ABR0U904_REHGL
MNQTLSRLFKECGVEYKVIKIPLKPPDSIELLVLQNRLKVGHLLIYVSAFSVSGTLGLGGIVVDNKEEVLLAWCSSRDGISSPVEASLVAVREALMKSLVHGWAEIYVIVEDQRLAGKLENKADFGSVVKIIADDIYCCTQKINFCGFISVASRLFDSCNRLASFAIEGEINQEWFPLFDPGFNCDLGWSDVS